MFLFRIITILLSFLSFILSINEKEMIVFPFKPIPLSFLSDYNNKIMDNETSENYNQTKFLDEHYIIRFFSPLKIGTPPQDIVGFINPDIDNLLIGEIVELPEKIFPDSFYKGYKYNTSSSFINKTSQNNLPVIDRNKFIGQEKICLYKDIDNIKNNNYSCFQNFTLVADNRINNNKDFSYGLVIGLVLEERNYQTNFMKQIKQKNIISSYLYSFEYINENEGLFIIGQYPHEYSPDKYKESQLKTLYPDKPSMDDFGINFDEIYSFINNGKVVVEENIKAKLLFNLGLIIGTNNYMIFIENLFFNQSIYTNICEKNYINLDFDVITIYSCNDKDNLNFENFPILYFQIKTANLTFEFNYKDLFKKINNKYYFLIIFHSYENDIWSFGRPFTLKYTYIYNADKKMLGFYEKEKEKDNKDEEKEKDNNNGNKDSIFELDPFKIIILIVLFLIFISLVIVVSYYFGKKCNSKRKSHANELDDNFEYFPNDESINK